MKCASDGLVLHTMSVIRVSSDTGIRGYSMTTFSGPMAVCALKMEAQSSTRNSIAIVSRLPSTN